MIFANPDVKLSVGRTPFEWVLEVVSLLCVCAAFVPLLFYGDLGDEVRIPIHFNFRGEADGWGGRSALWWPAVLTLGFYLIFSGVERYPRLCNYPVKVTPANAEALYRLGVRMVRRLKCVSLLLFAYIAGSSLAAALGGDVAGLNRVLLPLFLAGLFGLLGFFCLKMGRLKDFR